jgi:glucose-1-phosphate thymidylyltransferase
MYYSEVQNPERFGVYDGTTITEKPHKPSGNKAITGLYVYDDSVFGYIAELKPSDRGELEIADVNNKYLTAGAPVIEYKDFWSDMGTFDSLLNTAEHIRAWSGKA